MIALLWFPFFYLTEIVRGALRIGRDVLSPRPRLRPVMLRMPLEIESPGKRLLLACLISMTPGSLSVEEEGDTLLVHSLYGGDDPSGELEHLKKRYEAVVARLPF